MKTITVKLATHSYHIHVGAGLLDQAGRLLRENGFTTRAIIITDSKVRGLHGDRLAGILAGAGFDAPVIEVPAGEDQKSLETAGRLYHDLTRLDAERSTPVLAVGGGVIGDLAGFVAATYMRGVPLVQVPTTLLSQGDSSIGGKVAVNYGTLKNMIGTFYHPRQTISDLSVLKTLSPREISGGLSEIIKHGVIMDAQFFAYLENSIGKIMALDDSTLEAIVSRSAQIKAGVVELDELDMGPRNALNYGHTVGHAIESVSGLSIWHGEAVAIGMVAEARISNRLGMLRGEDVLRVKALLKKAGLPTGLPDLGAGRLMQAMRHDKKVLQGRLRFSLPKAIGEVILTDEVDPSLVEQVLVNRDEET